MCNKLFVLNKQTNYGGGSPECFGIVILIYLLSGTCLRSAHHHHPCTQPWQGIKNMGTLTEFGYYKGL